MIGSRLALIALLSTAMAAPAAAQYRKKRPNRVKAQAPFRADAWGPKRGRPGTRCWVSGRGFRKNMTVLVGGRQVRIAKYNPRRIEFDIPRRRYGNGRIVLRRRGYSDVSVGSFDVLPEPAIRGFRPRAGTPGTAVEIRGAHFEPDLRVLINGRAVRTDKISPRRIRFRVPSWAKSDYIVLAGDGYKVRSRRRFKVVFPEPVIRGLRPLSGAPGTRVRVLGEHFDGGEQVFYGRRRVRAVRHGNGWVEFVVPDWAKRPRRIRVKNQYGDATYRRRFELARPTPVIRSWSPKSGEPGTLVTLRGTHFGRRPQVYYGNRRLRPRRVRPGFIEVAVPDRMGPRRFRVVNRAGDSWTGSKFQIAEPVRIGKVWPRELAYGQKLNIAGDGYGRRVAVRVGKRNARVLSARGGRLVVEIPRGIRPGRRWVWVTANGTTAKSPYPIEIRAPAEVRKLTPRRTWRGGRFVIHGEGFGPKVRVRVDGRWWPIKRIGKRGRKIWVSVPSRAPHRGSYWVEVVKSGGYVARSPNKLRLVPPPGSNVRDKRRKRGY